MSFTALNWWQFGFVGIVWAAVSWAIIHRKIGLTAALIAFVLWGVPELFDEKWRSSLFFVQAVCVSIGAWSAFFLFIDKKFVEAVEVASLVAVVIVSFNVAGQAQKAADRIEVAERERQLKFVASDPGPRKATEIMFEAASRLCLTEDACILAAVSAAFGDDCKKAAQNLMQTDYKFHADEPLFVRAKRDADLEFTASGTSLFAQKPGSAGMTRRTWACFIKRVDNVGVRRQDYVIYAVAW